MPLIDQSYFVGELNIAGTGSTTTAVGQRLDFFIKKYETEFLNKVLGYELAEDFRQGLLADPIEQKWLDLRDGADFTYNNVLYRWDGFRNTETKQSPIANYVYFHYMRDADTQTTGIGEAKTNAANSVRVTPDFKLVRAWNEMSEAVKSLRFYLAATNYNSEYFVYYGWGWHEYNALSSGVCTRLFGVDLFGKINTFGL